MLTWGSVFEGNGQSVAVLWSYLGHDPLQTDAGQVVIHNAANIYCYDVMGKPYGHYDDRARTLTFDVGNPTLYLASSVSGRDLAKAVDGADITLNEPVKAMIEPLTGPAGEATPINVRLYNGGVREATGTVDVTVPGFSIAKSISFDVAPGKFDVVAVPVISASANTSNIYNATVTVTTKNAGSAVNVAQPFQAAYMTRFTPTIDGDLSDWAGKAPVTMATYEKGLDWGALALNPALFNQAQADGKPPIQIAAPI